MPKRVYYILVAAEGIVLNRRLILLALVVLFLTPFLFASKKRERAEPILHSVGFSLRQFEAPEGYNWRGSDDQTLSGIIWYPAETSAGEKDQYVGPADAPLFYAGRAAKDATLAPAFGKYPLIALSHGTGGSALQMAWLGTYLAGRGYIVVAVNHPGNNAVILELTRPGDFVANLRVSRPPAVKADEEVISQLRALAGISAVQLEKQE